MRYDGIIIGFGPAGLSAALTLIARNKNVAIIANEPVSKKVLKGHTINNYPGLPGISGAEFGKAFIEHATSQNIKIIEGQVICVYSMGDYFSLQTTDNDMYEASTVVIASGVEFGKTIKGEDEYLGRGVSYCATCDAMLYKGRKVVAIGADKKQEREVQFLSEICSSVVYIPTYEGEITLPENVKILRDKPMEITGKLKADTLILADGKIEADCIFILRDNVPPSRLVPGIKMDGNHIDVNRKMETNIPGCFAAGDITGVPYQYVKAAGEGNVAAISAAEYLDKKR